MRKILNYVFKRKILWVSLSVLFFIVFYILFCFFDEGTSHSVLLWKVPLYSLLSGLAVYTVLAFQVKNPICKDSVFSFVEIMFLALSLFTVIFAGIRFLLNLKDGFSPVICYASMIILFVFFADRTWVRFHQESGTHGDGSSV